MPWADPIDILVAEAAKFVELSETDLERPVPQYPGWTMAELAAHTGGILGRTTLICRDRVTQRPSAPRPGEGEDVLAWFRGQLDEMVDVLRSSDHGAEVWGFGPKPTIAFWVRRMLIEMGVHRWDAQSAFGSAEPLLNEVAVAGLDEYPEMWLPRLESEVRTLRLEATDLDRSWVYGEGDADADVAGTASDLYLRLMSRPSIVVLPEDWTIAVDGLAPPPR